MRIWQAALAMQVMAAAALAQTAGDPAAGRRLAEAQCGSCHAVGPGGPNARQGNAPPFAEVARMPSTAALALQVFLRSPHGGMPDLVLTPAQMDDLIAHILSLRGEPGR
jgi:mono/diheme cytochrome c family protein